MNDFPSPSQEKFLSRRQRSQPIVLPEEFSDEEMARDWTLSAPDRATLLECIQKRYRPWSGIQLCAARLYGRFLSDCNELSPRLVNYINQPLELPPSLSIPVPVRRQTRWQYQKVLLGHIGFRPFDDSAQTTLEDWLDQQARQGALPATLFHRAERRLLTQRCMLPGPSVLERLVIRVCSTAHVALFKSIHHCLSPPLREAIERLLDPAEGDQRSMFYQLKAYPPSASISSIQHYLEHYTALANTHLEDVESPSIDPAFLDYLFKLARRYNANDVKHFDEHKRYAMMICFLLESRKVILDHLVKMHDQYILDLCRHARLAHEKQHRMLRKRQKRAIDTVLATTDLLLDWSDNQPLTKAVLWQRVDEHALRSSIEDLRVFKRLEGRGYGAMLLSRYPSMRKYFAQFIQLPFAAERGSDTLLEGIELVRQLDRGELTHLPTDAPTNFVPRELRRALKNDNGKLNRNAWEMGLALAIKDAFRSGDLYLPQSKHYVSFWDLMMNESQWKERRDAAYRELDQPNPTHARAQLIEEFCRSTAESEKRFGLDPFAEIRERRLIFKRDDTKPHTTDRRLQKAINASLNQVRIEDLLLEVDRLTGFSRHFVPLQRHQARPPDYYKTLLAAIISQATNLGVVSMSASVAGISIDRLRHVLKHYVREETLKAASAEIVNQHHQLPLSAVHGKGKLSSSDAQRFKIRADSLLASYYPRYFGYYERAIGLYTHVSDQYSVFSTQVISCAPREALYVLDGLLDNNTILKIREHTTDTEGYTEIVFALCFLLGFYFMPRIKNLKDQQWYRVEKDVNASVFAPLLTKTVDTAIIEEQWDAVMRLATSLKDRTTPAHVIVQRLTSSYPADRLSKAITNLGRIIKTEYILRYLTDPELRRRVQRQLNKGEYRQKLPRWIFFADQGEFLTGDYVEIMNKASSLSLVCNAVLYWNTIKIGEAVDGLREQGEDLTDEDLSHISLLPYRHVLPNGTYFVDAP